MTDTPTARWARRAFLPHGSAGCTRGTRVIAYETPAQPALGSRTPVGHRQHSMFAGQTARCRPPDAYSRRGWRGLRERGGAAWREDCRQPETVIPAVGRRATPPSPRFPRQYPEGIPYVFVN